MHDRSDFTAVYKGGFVIELAKAWQRMGNTSADVMRWLLRFERCDLSTLSSGDWSNLQYELIAFRQDGVSLIDNALAHMMDPPLDSVHEDLMKHMSQPQIVSFQKMVTQTLEAIKTKQPTQLKFPSFERCLYFNPVRRSIAMSGKVVARPPQWVLRSTMHDPMEALTYWFLELMKDHANAIRQCPESGQPVCQGLFLAERKNQSFCSVNCQSRAATRRFRAEHGLSSGRPRGRPRKTNDGSSALKSRMNVQRRKTDGETKQ